MTKFANKHFGGIEAEKLTCHIVLGEECGAPGDYLVKVDGKLTIVPGEYFDMFFAEVKPSPYSQFDR